MQASGFSNPWTPTQEEIDRKPWKYLGYQAFSGFISSDNDFFILRRFEALTARILLRLQDQLMQLEEKLDTIEEEHRRKAGPDVHNGSFRHETRPERIAIMEEAHQVLKQYNDLVLQQDQVKARPKVPAKDIRSIENWHYNHTHAINAPETTYINHASDLFSLVPTPKSPLRRLLEKSQHFRLLAIWRRKDGHEADPTRDENIHYMSDQRIDNVIASLNTALGIVMLIAPLWILIFLGSLVSKLSVISAFIVLFLTTVSLATVANTYESLAATAAYSAVLMVFLQVSGSS